MKSARPARRRLTAFLLGAGLLAAAVWAVAGNQGATSAAWASLRNPDPAWVIALPLAILALQVVQLLPLPAVVRAASPGALGFAACKLPGP